MAVPALKLPPHTTPGGSPASARPHRRSASVAGDRGAAGLASGAASARGLRRVDGASAASPRVTPPWGVPAPAVTIEYTAPHSPAVPPPPGRSPASAGRRAVFHGGRGMGDWKQLAPVGRPHTWHPTVPAGLVSPSLASSGVADAMNHRGAPSARRPTPPTLHFSPQWPNATVYSAQAALFGVPMGAVRPPQSPRGTNKDSSGARAALDATQPWTSPTRHRRGRKHVQPQAPAVRPRRKAPASPPTERKEPPRGLRRVGHNAYWHESTEEAQLGPDWKQLRRLPEPPSRGHRPWSRGEEHRPRRVTAAHMVVSRPLWDPEPVRVRPRKVTARHLQRTSLWSPESDASPVGSSSIAAATSSAAPWCQRPFS